MIGLPFPRTLFHLFVSPNSSGVLLYGPPGTGKTLLARAVASASKATFINVSGSQLVRKTMGSGPKLVRKIFEIAVTKAPSIVFIDEIDAIGGKRYAFPL